jgi:hypothetical protein
MRSRRCRSQLNLPYEHSYKLSGQYGGLVPEPIVQFFFGLMIELFVTALRLSCSLP